MELVGRLAGGLAHEFNNLLTVVVGYARLSLEELEPDHAVAPHLEEIYRAGQACAQLTRQLLAFSRKQISHPVEVDLHAVLNDQAKTLRSLLGSAIQLDLELTAPDATIRADPAQLEQVLLMLTMNAHDAMPSGGMLTLRTEAAEVGGDALRGLAPGAYVQLSISDTSAGMDESTRRRVFEPFFTSQKMGRGTGLGLAAVLGMVQQNAGTIDVESACGQGTTFRVYLPAWPHRPAPVVSPAPQPAPVAAGRTVLIVEDEPVVRSFARAVLASQGVEVLIAGDGLEALTVFRERRADIDLVLADVVMPNMDGMQLAIRLRELAPDVRVSLMSGHPSPGEVVPHAKLVDIPLLAKPFTHQQLLEFVTARLASRVQGGCAS
jgi:two-component system cell cycle sensor histidine kinase/response regulator CckA